MIEAMVMMKSISLMLMLILKADFYDLMVCFTKCPSSNLRNKIAGARAKVEVSYRFALTSLVVSISPTVGGCELGGLRSSSPSQGQVHRGAAEVNLDLDEGDLS